LKMVIFHSYVSLPEGNAMNFIEFPRPFPTLPRFPMRNEKSSGDILWHLLPEPAFGAESDATIWVCLKIVYP